MRRIVKLRLSFWLISVPFFYLCVLPWLMGQLAHKAQAQGYAQCETHLAAESLAGFANSPMTAAQGEKYCHCVSDGLILTKNDVFDLVRHQPAAHLQTLGQGLADQCTTELHKELYGTAPVDDPEALIHL